MNSSTFSRGPTRDDISYQGMIEWQQKTGLTLNSSHTRFKASYENGSCAKLRPYAHFGWGDNHLRYLSDLTKISKKTEMSETLIRHLEKDGLPPFRSEQELQGFALQYLRAIKGKLPDFFTWEKEQYLSSTIPCEDTTFLDSTLITPASVPSPALISSLAPIPVFVPAPVPATAPVPLSISAEELFSDATLTSNKGSTSEDSEEGDTVFSDLSSDNSAHEQNDPTSSPIFSPVPTDSDSDAEDDIPEYDRLRGRVGLDDEVISGIEDRNRYFEELLLPDLPLDPHWKKKLKAEYKRRLLLEASTSVLLEATLTTNNSSTSEDKSGALTTIDQSDSEGDTSEGESYSDESDEEENDIVLDPFVKHLNSKTCSSRFVGAPVELGILVGGIKKKRKVVRRKGRTKGTKRRGRKRRTAQGIGGIPLHVMIRLEEMVKGLMTNVGANDCSINFGLTVLGGTGLLTTTPMTQFLGETQLPNLYTKARVERISVRISWNNSEVFPMAVYAYITNVPPTNNAAVNYLEAHEKLKGRLSRVYKFVLEHSGLRAASGSFSFSVSPKKIYGNPTQYEADSNTMIAITPNLGGVPTYAAPSNNVFLVLGAQSHLAANVFTAAGVRFNCTMVKTVHMWEKVPQIQ